MISSIVRKASQTHLMCPAESVLTTLLHCLPSARQKICQLKIDYPGCLHVRASLRCPNRWESLSVSAPLLSSADSDEFVQYSHYFVSESSRNFGVYICAHCLLIMTDGAAI